MDLNKRTGEVVVTTTKKVEVFDLTGLTGEELLILRNALYCYGNGMTSQCRGMSTSQGKTQAQVAEDLYGRMYP